MNGKRIIKKSLKIALTLSLIIHYTSVAHAYSDAMVSSKDGKAMFEVVFADQGDIYGDGKSTYTLPEHYKDAIGSGIQYWADILGTKSQNNQPIQVLVGTLDDANAYAAPLTNKIDTNALYISNAIQGSQELRWLDLRNLELEAEQDKPEDGAFINILIGKYLGADRVGSKYGWYIDAVTPIPENEQAADFVGTVRHEMGHALGIVADVIKSKDSDNSNKYYRFSHSDDRDNSWNTHLIDKNGNLAKSGMLIITSEQFNEIQKNDSQVKIEDYFILNEGDSAYFVGKNVSEVLNGAKFDGKDGLPVNGRESGSPELSHLQTMGMMSHRSYSNYTNFMEAELAVMQDIGYKIDRKNFFGYSVYDNNKTIINTKGYFARNAEGTAYIQGQYNTTALGVGLHVYGANNNITQAADILTVGNGAVGVRVDGSENKIQLAKGNAIHADGLRGIGMLVAYGCKHELTQEGTVTANGDGGIGVRFDFGSSALGAYDEYRGSYIRYIRFFSKEGTITSKMNWDFKEYSDYYPVTPELDGALVKNYNINGYLSGNKQAILIGKNAFVENINIGSGARIYGDITSEWKHFKTSEGVYDGGKNMDSLQLRYQGYMYDYDDYVPDLVTNLNFNTDISYGGNINGSDNMRLNVKEHELSYSGNADVVGVTVASDAALYGGSYTLNRQRFKNTEIKIPDTKIKSYMQTNSTGTATDAVDTGNFVSLGTIGALNQNGTIVDMQITAKANELGNTGNFAADGKLRFTAQNDRIGRINIDKFTGVALGQNGGDCS